MTFYRFRPNPDPSYGSGSVGVWTYSRCREKIPESGAGPDPRIIGDVVNGFGFRVSKSGFMIYESRFPDPG